MLKGVLISIEEAYDSLSSTEKQVAKYIMDHPKDVIGMSVQKLAELSKVSEATIVRLSRSLKCKGFKELKLRIAADLALLGENTDADEFQQFQVGSSAADLVESVSHNNAKSIRDSLTVLSADKVEEAIIHLSRARKIALFGIGASAVVAEDFKLKVLRINKWCETGFSGDMQAIIASNLTSEDVAVGISYTGKNDDVLHALRLAKDNGAKVISLTQFGSNPIAELADMQLFTSTLEQNYRNGAMASRIAQLNVIDILYVGMVNHQYEESVASIERTKQAVRQR